MFSDGQVGSEDGSSPVAVAPLPDPPVLVRALAAGPVEDDGSLRARLWDHAGLADAMLGVSLLDLFDVGPDAATDSRRPGRGEGDLHAAPVGQPDGRQPDGATHPDAGPRSRSTSPGRDFLAAGSLPGDSPQVDSLPVDSLPDAVRALLDVRGVVMPDDLDATVSAVGEVFRAVNRLESLAAVLLERARVQSLRTEALLRTRDPNVARASSVRRHELARRVLVADLAIETHHTEAAMAQRLTDAQALVTRAPRTLSLGLAGDVVWRNAARVADTVAELDSTVAARFDQRVAYRAAQQNPAQFARTARRVLEQVHPTPAEVRHGEAATKRNVALIPAKDGMAYLSLFTTAPAAHAILDRVSQVARTARAGGDARTQDQLRADVTTALLLDDGTLDLQTSASGSSGSGSSGSGSSASWAGAPFTDEPRPCRTGTSRPSSGATGTGHPSPGPAGPDPGHTDPARTSDQRESAGRAEGSSDEPLPVAGTLGDRFTLARIARAVRPKIHVTVPVLTLLGRIDEPGLLDGVVPIDAETARELAGVATSFTRLLTQPHTGKILAVGAETYRPPADLRHYVLARDGTCRFPGCTRRAAETDTDHTVAAADGGRTTVANLAPLCRRHHVLKHQARYTVTQCEDGDGAMTWTTPTGRRASTRPGPIPATVHTRRPSYPAAPDETDGPPDDSLPDDLPPPF